MVAILSDSQDNLPKLVPLQFQQPALVPLSNKPDKADHMNKYTDFSR
jgi:hypothetical protein